MQRKHLTKNCLPFVMKKLIKKVCIEGIYFNIINTVYDKPAANILSDEKLKEFPLRQEDRNVYS